MARVFEGHAAVRRKKVVKSITRTGALTLVLSWIRECSYNNVYSWVTSALQQMPRSIQYQIYPCAAPKSTASADKPGAAPALHSVPLGDAPADPVENPKRKLSGRQPRPNLKRPRWSVGALRPPPQSKQSEAPELDVAAAEGASPEVIDVSPLPSPLWLLQKILAKTDGLSKKPRGLHMQELPDSFANQQLIGEGSYAVTYRYRQHTLGDIALKVLKRGPDIEDFMSEVDFMAVFRHPNIVKCLDVVVRPKLLAIVMPYGGQSLRERLKASTGTGALPNWSALTSQFMAAVAYLHGQDVIHTDLKPMNVVVDSEDHLVVIDLGSCVVDRHDHRHLWLPRFAKQVDVPCGTIWYRAPETLLGWADIHKEVDIWAAGCTIWEIWVGSTLFKAWHRTTMIKKILAQLGPPKGDALSFFIKLPNWRRDMRAIRKEPMTWKQRLVISCPTKAHGHWLEQLLRLSPGDRTSASSSQAAMWNLPEV